MKRVLLLLALGIASCASPSFPVRIDGIDLVRTNPEQTVLLSGVDWNSNRPAADVRFPSELVVSKYRSVAAAVFNANHQDLVVVIDATVPGTLRFSSALAVPAAIEVGFSPDGRALTLVCEKDLLYGREANEGTLRVPLSHLTWHDSAEAAMEHGNRDDRWSRRNLSGT